MVVKTKLLYTTFHFGSKMPLAQDDGLLKDVDTAMKLETDYKDFLTRANLVRSG